MSVKTPDPLDILVGARIRIVRIRRGMSQGDLAEKIGVSFQQVKEYEKGTNRVGSSRLMRIAAILGIPISELFEIPGANTTVSQSPLQLLAGGDVLRFLTAFSQITEPHVRRSITRLVEAVADLQPTMKSSMVRPVVVKRLVPRPAGEPGASLDPHQCWLRGQNLLSSFDAASWQRGVTIFRDGIRGNPTFSPFYSSLVQMNNIKHFVHPGLFRDPNKTRATLEFAKTAVQLDPVDSRAHLCCGWSYAMAHREAEAVPHMDLACELNDGDAWPLLSSASWCGFSGSIVQAQLRAEQALALSPRPSPLEWGYHGIIRFLCGDYTGAVKAIDRAQGIIKTLPAWRAASLFHLGERTMAQEEAQQFLNRIRSCWIGLGAPGDETITRWLLQAHPISVPARWKALRHGVRGAGLPVEGITQLS